MCAQKQLLVVTDLDGSLLNHDYTWAEAKPALAMLKAYGIPLVLNSSKTVSEMKELVQDLGVASPIVAENGGLLAVPEGSELSVTLASAYRSGSYAIEINGLSRDFILAQAHQLREAEGYSFSGFSDWSAEQVSERTGLSLTAANRSRSRYATEPIIWEDSDERLQDFQAALMKRHIRVLRGGRFLHLMGDADKANGTAATLKLYQSAQPDVEWVVVALGDSANDLAMLEAADIAVVIPHADGPHLNPNAPRVVHAPFTASKGWNAALLTILDEYC